MPDRTNQIQNFCNLALDLKEITDNHGVVHVSLECLLYDIAKVIGIQDERRFLVENKFISPQLYCQLELTKDL